jgi:enoyl-CoA hydratase
MSAALPSRIPHKFAMELMLLCRVFDAEKCERVGLVNEVVPEGEALARAIEWGKEIAGFAPLVTHAIKRMVLDDILPRGPSEQWALQLQRLSGIRESADFKEGVAAFRDKRPPQFTGE